MDWLLSLPPPSLAAIISAVVSAIVALVLAALNPIAQHRLERARAEFQRELEKLKAQIAQARSYEDARTSYEFEARKRLYVQIEPLLFLLFEAAEGSYYRVVSLVRTQRQGNLGGRQASWLSRDGYYLRSTIYRLFLPLAIFRLIQRSATFVDLRLDESTRTRYFLLKISSYAMTDDFVFANLEPKLTYSPNVGDWLVLRQTEPARYWRQGLVIGHLDRLIDALIVKEGDGFRPMNYGEFEERYATDEGFQKNVAPACDMFLEFNFQDRPVLGRVLLAHAYVMRLLILSYLKSEEPAGLRKTLADFVDSEEAKRDLSWLESEYSAVHSSVHTYVEQRLSWITHDEYNRHN